MSYNLQNVCNCPALQQALDGNFGNCNYDAIRNDDGFTMFLVSPVNTNGALQRNISPGNGKVRTVELTYTQRYNPSHARDTAELDCDGGLAPSNYCEQYTLDPTEGTSWGISFDPNNYREDCSKTFEEWVADEFQKAMAALIGRIDQKNIETMSTNFGEFVTTGLVGPFQTQTQSTDTRTDLKLIEDVTYESMMNYYCSVPFAFGGGELYKYFRRVAAGCCVDPIGADVRDYNNQNGIVFVADRNVETIIGTNHFFTVSAGAVQMLTWNRFEGGRMSVVNDGSYVQGTITDPFTGIKFDYFLQIDCGVWKGWIGLAHKLVFLPLDIVAPDDALYGANWTNHYQIVNS